MITMPAPPQPAESFCKTYDLNGIRPTGHTPFPHQSEALRALNQWFDQKTVKPGAILALPTGGGKTFTSWHFLCQGPLSQGYKVLWLAHTHHLLEQAFYSLEREVGHIQQRTMLTVRVVSGTKGHFKAADIKPSDDVVIATLQTARNAQNRGNKAFHEFIKSAGKKLFIVFDEAHHSPATTYCKLLNDFRDCSPKHFLLGLTATPTYSNFRRRGWLEKLFPDNVLYTKALGKLKDRLIDEGILARPIYEDHKTDVVVELEDKKYRQWMQSSRDLPDDIVTQLAENQARNELIAKVYASNPDRYGKTIIFADRKVQCIAICEKLKREGIKADYIFTHVEAEFATADERNKVDKTHNKEVLERFKKGELQVLVNVQMLTTGTDIPDVASVFLTRQTTSQILLTQMIGRALRGPKAGGTEKAYIVCFIDNWQQIIDWPLFEFAGGTEEGSQETAQPPREIEYISIDLIRQLAQIESAVKPGPFLSLMPVGWYLTEIEMIDQNEDSELVQRLAMVFDHEKEQYDASIRHFCSMKTEALAMLVEVDYEEAPDNHLIWAVMQQFFPNIEGTQRLLTNLYLIAKHIYQNPEPPEWFNFESRSDHDLDAIAEKALKMKIPIDEIDDWLVSEYKRDDRFWQAFYKSFSHFRVYFDACIRRVKDRSKQSLEATIIEEVFPIPPLDEKTKEKIRNRDRFQCQCCGDLRKNQLQVDHIKALFHGGTHDLANLQLLCKTCNQEKGIQEINFRTHKTQLLQTEERFPDEMLKVQDVYSMTQWEKCLRRSINFFYKAAVVKNIRRIDDIGNEIEIGKRWEVSLYPGNDPKWIRPHLIRITRKIRKQTLPANIQQPTRIAVGNEMIMVVTGD